MPARDEQRDKRRGEIGILDRGCKQMSLHVVDTDQLAPASVGQRLGIHHAHEQGAHKARPLCHRDRVHRAPGEAGLGEGAIHHRRQRGQMRPAGELGYDAAEHAMDVLGQDD